MKSKFKKLAEDSVALEAHARLMDFLQNDADCIAAYYGTLLACAKMVGEFVLENHDIKKLPRHMQYLLVLIWNSYAMVYDKDREKGIVDIDFQNYFEGGCLDDRFATVVKQLYQICKEEKLL